MTTILCRPWKLQCQWWFQVVRIAFLKVFLQNHYHLPYSFQGKRAVWKFTFWKVSCLALNCVVPIYKGVIPPWVYKGIIPPWVKWNPSFHDDYSLTMLPYENSLPKKWLCGLIRPFITPTANMYCCMTFHFLKSKLASTQPEGFRL